MKLEHFRPSLPLVRLIGEIDEFKGAWRSLSTISPERLATLKRVATIESIGSSTRIEGVSLSDQQIEALLSGLQTYSFRSRDEEEVAGYAELMETIFSNWQQIPLTENFIKQLHGILLKYSVRDESHRGHYKTVPNHVEAFDAYGHSLGIIFETASPFNTPFRMTALVDWTDRTLIENEVHPLLVIGIFVAEFLAIHPFKDGNGRLSRALTTLLLLKSGYLYVPYSSMESVIEKSKEAYYLALRRTQISLTSDEPDWESWLLYFMRAMQTQKLHLQTKMERERLLQGDLPPLSIRILELAREQGSLKSSDILRFTGESKSTIRSRLNELVDQGRLSRNGAGPSTWYTLPASARNP